MATYYDITLTGNIAHGSDILNKPCTVVFTYPDGSYSNIYLGKILAWPTANSVRISSAVMNIDAAWVGANGGTLTINAGGGGLAFGISAFSKMP